jgi:hypothetical protein
MGIVRGLENLKERQIAGDQGKHMCAGYGDIRVSNGKKRINMKKTLYRKESKTAGGLLKKLICLSFLLEQEEWVSTAIVIVIVVAVVKLDWVTLLSLLPLSTIPVL